MTRNPLLAGGAGDNAASAAGLSAVGTGDAFISLGTSGVLWATTSQFVPLPQETVHAFCHAVPNTWHQMGVTLSAAAALSWWSRVVGLSERALLGELHPRATPAKALFLPYLAGELTQAVIEGVALSLRDCLEVLRRSGSDIQEATVIGGGARSAAWVCTLASVLGIPLHRIDEGESIAALGAARLARIAFTGESVAAVCAQRSRLETILPDADVVDAYSLLFDQYRRLTAATRDAMRVART